MDQRPIRVRFAPSNTGFLHVGGVRTALFNYLFARQHDGTFILRIEDTDLERSEDRFTEAILHSMRWMGLHWDEGPAGMDHGGDGPHSPYFQSKRLKLYEEAAQKLLDTGQAYYSFAEAKGIEAKSADFHRDGERAPYREASGLYGNTPINEAEERIANGETPAIRFRCSGDASFEDVVRGRIEINGDDLDDFVIMKSQKVDGFQMATYNFACVVDDSAMEISHVLRGDDHISNTPKQLLLFRALGYEPPLFGHLPMILGPDKSRLSKRHGAISTTWFEENGYLPESLMNFLALLGWSLDDKTEYFSREELIKHFSLERVQRSPAVFDYAKLDNMNAHYCKDLPEEKKLDLCLPFMQREGFIGDHPTPDDKAQLTQLITAIGDRLHKLSDVVTYGRFLYVEDDAIEFEEKSWRKHVMKDTARNILQDILDRLRNVEGFDVVTLEENLKAYAEEKELGLGKVFQPLRTALTGSASSFGIFDILLLLGRERSLQRLEFVLNRAVPAEA